MIERNFLVIGNSIAEHGKCRYWPARYGMAASAIDKDFVHLVEQKLAPYGVVATVVNMANFEMMSYDRAESLALLDKALLKKYDLVIIQLGENTREYETFEEDLLDMMNYVTESQGRNVPTIFLGNFWQNDELDNIKKRVCQRIKSAYIDLKDIQNNEQYMAGIGYQVHDFNGNIYSVNHKGVALHPNDRAMEVIANRIVDRIKFQ